MPFPVIADESDVQAFDATQQAYEVSIDIVSGKRYAFGVAALLADDGDQVEFSVDSGGGFASIGTRTLNNENLANPTEYTHFEDGIIWTADVTGTITVKAAVSSGTWTIEGVILREPDWTGIVEDQGSGTHCFPLALKYSGNGSTYQLHSEMYSGKIFLTKDGAAVGELFDGVSGDYNERYHNGCAIQEHPNGIVVCQVGHNQPFLRFKFLPSGDFAQLSSEYQAGDAGGDLTYVMLAVLPTTGDVYALTRGHPTSNGHNALCYVVSDIDDIDGAGASDTVDVIATAERWYPRYWELMTDGSGKYAIGATWGVRDDPTGTTQQSCAAIFDPINNNWYSVNGHAATVQGSLGTIASPRFSSSQTSTLTKDGNGISIVGPNSTDTRYLLQGALWSITQWPDASTAAKGTILMAFTDLDEDVLDYGTGSTRFCIQNAGTRLVSPTNFTGPSLNNPNTARQAWAIVSDGSGGAFFAITNRTDSFLPTNTYANPIASYYNWGTGDEIEVYSVANPFASTIAFTHIRTINANPALSAEFLTPVEGDDERFIYQNSRNTLSETHVQAERVRTTYSADNSVLLPFMMQYHG